MFKLILPIVSLSVALFSLYMAKSTEKALEESSTRIYKSMLESRKENTNE